MCRNGGGGVLGWCQVVVVGGWLIGYALQMERKRERKRNEEEERALTVERENKIKY